MKSPRLPNLVDKCGRYFTYRDLVECGDTWETLRPDNRPRAMESYVALQRLAEYVLDPTYEKFGPLTLTYGFSGSELLKKVQGRIAPKIDQHAAHEIDEIGQEICPRGGAACDFVVEGLGSAKLAQWVAAHTDFDRVYYYGDRMPIHVSASENPARKCTIVVRSESGRVRPVTYKKHRFVELDLTRADTSKK